MQAEAPGSPFTDTHLCMLFLDKNTIYLESWHSRKLIELEVHLTCLLLGGINPLWQLVYSCKFVSKYQLNEGYEDK